MVKKTFGRQQQLRQYINEFRNQLPPNTIQYLHDSLEEAIAETITEINTFIPHSDKRVKLLLKYGL
jgi:hypothetical protein